MAIVASIPEKKQTPSAMKGVLTYCCQAQKTRLDEQTVLVSGIHCLPDAAVESFLATQKLQNCGSGQVRFYHYVQSFRAEDPITPEQAHEIGRQLGEYFGTHETVVATHLDNGQLHNHFVVNAYDFTGGKKLHMNKFTLKEMRDFSDRLCEAYGISVLKAYDPKAKSTNLQSREYRAALKGQSWKFRLMADIDGAMQVSGNRESFIRRMGEKGYVITWTPERSCITYTCPNGRKCRDKNLHHRKYTKEEMEFEFAIREAVQRHSEQVGQSEYRSVRYHGTDTVSADRLRYTGGTAIGRTEFAPGSGELSAKSVPADWKSGNLGAHQQTAPGNPGDAAAIFTANGRGDDRGKSSGSEGDAGEHLTGWEEARAAYFRLRAGGQSPANGYEWRDFPAGEKVAAHRDYHIRSSGSVLGAGLRGILEVGKIIEEDTEEPEQQRKRMEAQQAGSDLGAMLGLALGVAEQMKKRENQTENVGGMEHGHSML